MTDDFDDDALRSALGSRSGGPVQTGPARDAVIGRAQRTRTLRTAAVGGTATLAVVAAFVLLPGGEASSPAPADQPGTATVTLPVSAPDRSVVESSSSLEESDDPEPTAQLDPQATGDVLVTASPSTNPAVGPATSDVVAVDPGPAGGAVTSVTPMAPAVPSTVGDPVEPPSTATPSPPPSAVSSTPTSSTPVPSTVPTSSAPTSSTNPADPPFTKQYVSAGGSITVDWNGSALSLLSIAPNPGFEVEVEDQGATRIRVRFRGETDHRIEVRADDGQVESTIS